MSRVFAQRLWLRILTSNCHSIVLSHHHNEHVMSAIDPAEVTKVCLRLRHLIQECVPCEMEESKISRAHSRIITKKVVEAAKAAGGEESKACVVRRHPCDHNMISSTLTHLQA